jgi:decaprenylphospho-beta-D-erythro-pentofuranosid-2-ulose 2-reductase
LSKQAVLILGARSDIGMAVAHRFAAQGYRVQLAARDAASLETDKSDIEVRHGASVTLHEFDALATQTHAAFVAGLPELPAIAVCAVGLLGDQTASERDAKSAIQVMRSNYEGPASILAELANRFVERGSGTLVGISSVAGLRGRATNYVYGSAKAALTTFLSGLRNRLARHDVHVVTILPGFVATRMTEHMDLPKLMTARPQEVAEAIHRAAEKKYNIIYVRPVWRVVMSAIKLIPESVFKKMRL